MSVTGQIFDLDGSRRSDVDGMADLHARHLADSPVVLLGDRFLRDFYYGLLSREGLVRAVGCRVGDEVVGFISYTVEPLGFMTKAVKKHPIRLSWLMLMTVLRSPARLKEIFMVLRLMSARKGEEESGAVPEDRIEVLSMASERKHGRLVPEGGTERLSVRLFSEMVDRCREAGAGSLHFLVQPNNSASNMFCSALGCRFEKIHQAGWTIHRYVYTIPPAE